MESSWLKPNQARKYAGNICRQTLSDWYQGKNLPGNIKHLDFVRLPSGAIMIKKEWIDDFLCQFKDSDSGNVKAAAQKIMKEFYS